MARPCHASGNTLPYRWHGLATRMAQRCHHNGTAVPKERKILAQQTIDKQLHITTNVFSEDTYKRQEA